MTIKIGKGFYVPIDNILFFGDMDQGSIKRKIRQMKKEGLVLDLSAGKTALSAVFLKNGQAILTIVKADTISERFVMEGK